MTGQEQGYVEYGVRCPDGVIQGLFLDRGQAVRASGAASQGHVILARDCRGAHEVVQRTVGPWQEACRG